MNVRYRVELSQAERGELTAMLSKGKRAALRRYDHQLRVSASYLKTYKGPYANPRTL